MFKRQFSESHKEKIRQAKKGKPMSRETKEKISTALKARWAEALDKKGKIVLNYDTSNEEAENRFLIDHNSMLGLSEYVNNAVLDLDEKTLVINYTNYGDKCPDLESRLGKETRGLNVRIFNKEGVLIDNYLLLDARIKEVNGLQEVYVFEHYFEHGNDKTPKIV